MTLFQRYSKIDLRQLLVMKDNKNRDVKFPIHEDGGLYFLYRVSTSVPDVQSRSLSDWHKILGHCNTSDIVKLEGLVDGMKITNKNDQHCDDRDDP